MNLGKLDVVVNQALDRLKKVEEAYLENVKSTSKTKKRAEAFIQATAAPGATQVMITNGTKNVPTDVNHIANSKRNLRLARYKLRTCCEKGIVSLLQHAKESILQRKSVESDPKPEALQLETCDHQDHLNETRCNDSNSNKHTQERDMMEKSAIHTIKDRLNQLLKTIWTRCIYPVVEEYRKMQEPGMNLGVEAHFEQITFYRENMGFYHELYSIVLSVDDLNSEVSIHLRKAIFICLGDLARYLGTARTYKEGRNDPLFIVQAQYYYNEAVKLDAENGYAHNQLACISVDLEDELASVFHLCKAATARHPHRSAIANIIRFSDSLAADIEQDVPERPAKIATGGANGVAIGNGHLPAQDKRSYLRLLIFKLIESWIPPKSALQLSSNKDIVMASIWPQINHALRKKHLCSFQISQICGLVRMSLRKAYSSNSMQLLPHFHTISEMTFNLIRVLLQALDRGWKRVVDPSKTVSKQEEEFKLHLLYHTGLVIHDFVHMTDIASIPSDPVDKIKSLLASILDCWQAFQAKFSVHFARAVHRLMTSKYLVLGFDHLQAQSSHWAMLHVPARCETLLGNANDLRFGIQGERKLVSYQTLEMVSLAKIPGLIYLGFVDSQDGLSAASSTQVIHISSVSILHESLCSEIGLQESQQAGMNEMVYLTCLFSSLKHLGAQLGTARKIETELSHGQLNETNVPDAPEHSAANLQSEDVTRHALDIVRAIPLGDDAAKQDHATEPVNSRSRKVSDSEILPLPVMLSVQVTHGDDGNMEISSVIRNTDNNRTSTNVTAETPLESLGDKIAVHPNQLDGLVSEEAPKHTQESSSQVIIFRETDMSQSKDAELGTSACEDILNPLKAAPLCLKPFPEPFRRAPGLVAPAETAAVGTKRDRPIDDQASIRTKKPRNPFLPAANH